jgi:hypothetical protein
MSIALAGPARTTAVAAAITGKIPDLICFLIRKPPYDFRLCGFSGLKLGEPVANSKGKCTHFARLVNRGDGMGPN